MAQAQSTRTRFTTDEFAEIRAFLAAMPTAPRSVRRMSMARLRRMGLQIAIHPEQAPSLAEFETQVSSGAVEEVDAAVARAPVDPHPSGNVFRVAVGVTGDSVEPDWSAFEERFHWFGKAPQQVTSGAHLFVLAVDRWRSAVVGLYEAVSAGAQLLPDSPDPDRWPWAIGVRPLAAILPPQAERVSGQIGPQSGLPERVYDSGAQAALYAAVADSPPPPGPHTLEQRVQELEPVDVVSDVFEAIRTLGKDARRPNVIERAIEIGGWTEPELAARAWYTGSGSPSHVENIVGRAIEHALLRRELVRTHSVLAVAASDHSAAFGTAYQRASGRPSVDDELPAHLVDIAELERATERHMELQDRLADELARCNVEPRSAGSWEPAFDLAFEHHGARYVAEIKSGNPVTPQQVRLGAGQVLEYCHRLRGSHGGVLCPVLLVEAELPAPWETLAAELGIAVLRADRLAESVSMLLAAGQAPDSTTADEAGRGQVG